MKHVMRLIKSHFDQVGGQPPPLQDHTHGKTQHLEPLKFCECPNPNLV